MDAAVIEKLREVFAPDEMRQRLDLTGTSLVHYCSAETAMRIIKNGEIWLRNVRVMNDVMEIEHGFQLLQRSFQSGEEDSPLDHGIRAVGAALDEVLPGVSTAAIHQFDLRLEALRHDT